VPAAGRASALRSGACVRSRVRCAVCPRCTVLLHHTAAPPPRRCSFSAVRRGYVDKRCLLRACLAVVTAGGAQVCGARSCPPIHVYQAATLDDSLDFAARALFGDAGSFRVDATGRIPVVWLSSILQWCVTLTHAASLCLWPWVIFCDECCAVLFCAASCGALCGAMRCAVRCAAVRCAALLCAALRCCALRCCALRCAAVRCAAVWCCDVVCCAVLCCVVLWLRVNSGTLLTSGPAPRPR
jgi:hypothetical protein